jgi:elongation factor P
VKLRNVRTDSTIERTFKSGERFNELSLSRRPMQYLYAEGDQLTFMDPKSFDQITVPRVKIGDPAKFLTEDMEVQALYLEDEFLGIDLPASVEMRVVSTVPGVKGDSVSNMVKPATLENNVEVMVPLFIKEGEAIRIDTRSGDYVGRV